MKIAPRKLALLGTSNAGKTTCALQFGFGSFETDMDERLATDIVPTVDTMLQWIERLRSPVVAVSVHDKPLEEMIALKQNRSDGRFSRLSFVYLYAKEHKLVDRHSQRHPEQLNHTGKISGYEKLDRVFRLLMDEFVDTTNLTPNQVHAIVSQIAHRSGQSIARHA